MSFRFVFLLLGVFASQVTSGQESTFYYSKGNKVQVEVIDAIAIRVDPRVQLDPKTIGSKLMQGNTGYQVNKIEILEQSNVAILPASGLFTAADIKKAITTSKIGTFAGFVVEHAPSKSRLVVNGRIVARLKDDATVAQIHQIYNDCRLVEISQSTVRTGRVVLQAKKFDSARDVFVAANKLFESKLVEYAHPDFIVAVETRDVIPNDSLFGNQWHLHNTGQGGGSMNADIDAPEAWEISQGNSAVRIAVLDQGIQVDHPDLSPNYGAGYDVVASPYDSDPRPEWNTERHGTAVAGIVGAKGDNLIGVTGSCPNCTLLAVRMLGGSYANHADAFDWAVSNDAHVITNSWGYPIGLPLTDDIVAAIENAVQNGRGGKGCVVLFAMTNQKIDNCSGENPDISSINGVIAVSGATNQDVLEDGGFGSCMSVLGPTRGGTLGITTTDRTGLNGYSNGDYTPNFGGTSAATPVVAGVCGLVLAVNDSLSAAQVKTLVEQGADQIDAINAGYDPSTGFSSTHGHGRVNAHQTLLATPGKN